MKTKFMLLAATVALSGCNSTDNIPNPSPEQEKAAQLAYDDLRDGKYEEFLDQLEPQLQTQFKDNEKLMKRFSRSIPQGEYKSKTLMTKQIEEATATQPGQYKISYEIAHPNNLVQYDVSFDQPNGSNKIRNFNIQVFGES
ncbi:MAG: DUF3887 domain-containing protein [Acinetobacter sp.]